MPSPKSGSSCRLRVRVATALATFAQQHDLTPRQRELVERRVFGASRAEAVEAMGIAASTYDDHASLIFRKTGRRVSELAIDVLMFAASLP